MEFSQSFWSKKYEHKKTGWDLGKISPPLKAYFDQLTNKDLKILIPGGGNSYEAEYLFNNGFKNVYVVDIAAHPLNNIKNRVPDFPDHQLIHLDFFDMNTTFDLIVEQTFFCAIHPSFRSKYAEKMETLLNPNGKLVGLLFEANLNEDHPPFGGSRLEYSKYFKPYFKSVQMEPCYNSYQNRQGMELFVKIEK